MSVSKKLNKTELALLLFLLHMPYASRVDPNLNSLLDRKLIAYEVQGWMRDAQRRLEFKPDGRERRPYHGVIWLGTKRRRNSGHSRGGPVLRTGNGVLIPRCTVGLVFAHGSHEPITLRRNQVCP